MTCAPPFVDTAGSLYWKSVPLPNDFVKRVIEPEDVADFINCSFSLRVASSFKNFTLSFYEANWLEL